MTVRRYVIQFRYIAVLNERVGVPGTLRGLITKHDVADDWVSSCILKESKFIGIVASYVNHKEVKFV